MNVIIATPLSDTAAVTGTDALGDNSVVNLQRRDLSLFYRAPLVSEINIDLGLAVDVDLIALISHTGQGNVIVKAGDTPSAEDYTSGSLPLITGADANLDENMFALKLDSVETYRYWKLEIDDTGNADGFIDIGRLYVSEAFQPSTNASYGMEEGIFDRSRIGRTMSGAISAVKRPPLRKISLKFNFGSEAEMYGQARDIDTMRGISEDILIIPDYDDLPYFQKRYVYGTMTEINPIVIAAFAIYQKTYQVTEIK